MFFRLRRLTCRILRRHGTELCAIAANQRLGIELHSHICTRCADITKDEVRPLTPEIQELLDAYAPESPGYELNSPRVH